MKRLRYFLLTALFFLLCCGGAFAQNNLMISNTSSAASADEDALFKPIARYLGSGDTESLSAWLAPSVEITLLSSVTSTSKSHARNILDDFFRTHTPQSFQVTHVAAQPNLKYAVGILSAGGEKFDVTLFAAYSEGEGFRIRQIKIDRSTSVF